jgi:hypothetical protein
MSWEFEGKVKSILEHRCSKIDSLPVELKLKPQEPPFSQV